MPECFRTSRDLSLHLVKNSHHTRNEQQGIRTYKKWKTIPNNVWSNFSVYQRFYKIFPYAGPICCSVTAPLCSTKTKQICVLSVCVCVCVCVCKLICVKCHKLLDCAYHPIFGQHISSLQEWITINFDSGQSVQTNYLICSVSNLVFPNFLCIYHLYVWSFHHKINLMMVRGQFQTMSKVVSEI